MANSDKYLAIRQVLVNQPTMAVSAQWKGGTARTLWPLVIGTTPAGDDIEKLLCFDYDSTNPTARRFRCFIIDDLTVSASPATPWPVAPPPNGLKFKQVKKQNCVDDVDVYRQKT